MVKQLGRLPRRQGLPSESQASSTPEAGSARSWSAQRKQKGRATAAQVVVTAATVAAPGEREREWAGKIRLGSRKARHEIPLYRAGADVRVAAKAKGSRFGRAWPRSKARRVPLVSCRSSNGV